MPERAIANDGHPWFATRGLLNILPYIFGNYHQADTSDNIYDPVANTAAAMNYIMDRYGISKDGPKIDLQTDK
ncbi:transglycosylase SLT domain-containing protein [Mycobacteroides abscessus subsp. bolletii]|uniref:hypothetical protein n=1 Tax=Mycobacteroides abscessus TaxID=36809 RepID=UPI0009C5596A|nr:hypothetical protein [Mycobacteroides abscessus]SKG85776.1 transglycosylase SLT domain-containing protein [Mycobacteroides abscessus subsp. bolletii]SKH44738.1 transglycosylase SLT domain-containing protein [Mycobacteroides abscessus subsp. bolletii]